MNTNKKGFTLLELMLTIGVVGVLAIIAVPTYSNYVAKAQVTEAVYALGHAKNVAIEYHANQGVYPRTAELQELSNTRTTQLRNTEYLNLITTNQSESNKYYEINLRFINEGKINSNVRNKHLTFRLTYATKQWDCVSEDIKQEYLPGVCKYVPSNNS